MTRYVTWRRAWPNTVMIGISVTWHSDNTVCFMLHVFTHVLLIGPHYSGQ